MSSARARIADVAREAGVSKAAVSFAFNKPDRLRIETANRIRAVAHEMGYRPHPVARMLSAGQTSTIGIVSPQPLGEVFANPFFSLFAEGVASVTEQHGLSLLLISPLHGSLARSLERASVDGIVVLGVDHDHAEVDAIRTVGLPLVSVDAPAWPEHGAIRVDDEGGAYAAAEHLLQLGHRELLVISVEPPLAGRHLPDSVAGSRMRGYRRAFAHWGVEVLPEHVVSGPATLEGGESAFLGIWRQGMRPTAVLSMSDAAAAGVLQACRFLGLHVPTDISIVGFDDLPFTRLTDPPLTTVHQPVRQKGAEAASLLLGCLGSASSQAQVHHRVLGTRLLVRGSTAARAGTHGSTPGQEVVVVN